MDLLQVLTFRYFFPSSTFIRSITFSFTKSYKLFSLKNAFVFSQREFEQRAAIMGGGNFVVPVQNVKDFMDNKLSGKILIWFMSLSPSVLHCSLSRLLLMWQKLQFFVLSKKVEQSGTGIAKDINALPQLTGFFVVSASNIPSSSYRLGVKAANLHELFPVHITEALQHSIMAFDQEVFYFDFAQSSKNPWVWM